jgi:hypothetical protein
MRHSLPKGPVPLMFTRPMSCVIPRCQDVPAADTSAEFILAMGLGTGRVTTQVDEFLR